MKNIILSLLNYKLIPVTSSEITYDAEIVDADNLVIDYFVKKLALPTDKSYISYVIERYGEERALRRYIAQDKEHPYGPGCYSTMDECTFKLDSINYAEIIDGKGIIEPIFNDNSVILKKYIINIKANTLSLKDILVIKIENDEFSFYLNDKKVEDIKDFLNASVMLSDYEDCLKTLIYNNHVKKPACKDIYLDYLIFFKNQSHNNERMLNNYLITQYYNYMSSEKFLLLFEFNIKHNIEVNSLTMQNPIFSGKPYEDISVMKSISKTSMDIITEMNSRRTEKNELIALFGEMESNPKIGVNGIKYIYDICKTIDNIYIEELWGVFRNCNADIYKEINDVMNLFDISLKTLMERAIKGMFYEQNSLSTYLECILDYVEMKKMLGLEVETKLPKNIIELHDGLTSLIQDIKEQETKEKFEAKAKENKILADNFNLVRKDKTYVIVSPEKSNDLIVEGQNMHHCVGSYIERLANGYSKIFFIREEKNPDVSLATLELDNKNNYVQAKAKFNANVSKDVDKFITDFIEYLGGEKDDE